MHLFPGDTLVSELNRIGLWTKGAEIVNVRGKMGTRAVRHDSAKNTLWAYQEGQGLKNYKVTHPPCF